MPGEAEKFCNRIKLSDFGQALHCKVGQCSPDVQRGTLLFNAPEMLRTDGNQMIHSNSDTFAMALTILDLAGISREDALADAATLDAEMALWRKTVFDLLPFIQSMLVIDPRQRITRHDLHQSWDPCSGLTDTAVVDKICSLLASLSYLLADSSKIDPKNSESVDEAISKFCRRSRQFFASAQHDFADGDPITVSLFTARGSRTFIAFNLSMRR